MYFCTKYYDTADCLDLSLDLGRNSKEGKERGREDEVRKTAKEI